MVIKVNDDEELVEPARKMIKENGGYCPCAITKKDEYKCMCKEFLEQNSEGLCYCGLYKKVEM